MKKCTFKTTGVCAKTCEAYDLFDHKDVTEAVCLVDRFYPSVEMLHDTTRKMLQMFDRSLETRK